MNSTECGLTFEQNQMIYLTWVYVIFGFTTIGLGCMVRCCCSPHEQIMRKLNDIHFVVSNSTTPPAPYSLYP